MAKPWLVTHEEVPSSESLPGVAIAAGRGPAELSVDGPQAGGRDARYMCNTRRVAWSSQPKGKHLAGEPAPAGSHGGLHRSTAASGSATSLHPYNISPDYHRSSLKDLWLLATASTQRTRGCLTTPTPSSPFTVEWFPLSNPCQSIGKEQEYPTLTPLTSNNNRARLPEKQSTRVAI